MDSEFIAAANAALSGQALTSSPVLQGLSLAADGTLPEPQLIEAFERHRARLGSEPIASFKQALSDVMFFLLFQAGELLESRADEDLARRVKELLATLETAVTDLPRLTEGVPGCGGAFKLVPEDFEVEELPAYLPSGEGEHLFLWVEKRGRDTREVVRALAQALGLPEGEIGVAGMKDRHAVTRQLISVPARAEPQAAGLLAGGRERAVGAPARQQAADRAPQGQPLPAAPAGREGRGRGARDLLPADGARRAQLLRRAALRARAGQRGPGQGAPAGPAAAAAAGSLPAQAVPLRLPVPPLQPGPGRAPARGHLRPGAPGRRAPQGGHRRPLRLRGAGGGWPSGGRLRGEPRRAHVRPEDDAPRPTVWRRPRRRCWPRRG